MVEEKELPKRLDDISEKLSGIPKKPDEKTLDEEQSLENEQRKAETQRLRQETAQRDFIVPKIVKLVSWWLAGIFILILLSGIGTAFEFFTLSDKIIIILVSGTTINVLGLLAIVVRYLFRR